MGTIEKICIAIRNAPGLKGRDALWATVRPKYDRAVARIAAKRGLPRVINGAWPIRVCTECRNIRETHEPDAWSALLTALRPGDVFCDVGANIGLYAIAAALRVGPKGKVFAFEPHPGASAMLTKNVLLNHVADVVVTSPLALGDAERTLRLEFKETESTLVPGVLPEGAQACLVTVTTLDTALAGARVDVMKIDVEGFEQQVLFGAQHLLRDKARRPRMILIEVHPFAWPAAGTSSESLLDLLNQLGYTAADLGSHPIKKILDYGQLVALPSTP